MKVRKRATKKLRLILTLTSGEVIINPNNSVVPVQAIGFMNPPQNPKVLYHSNPKNTLFNQTRIIQNIKRSASKINLTSKEIDELYQLSVEYNNGSIGQDELLARVKNLRGGSMDIDTCLLIIIGVILILKNSNGFQVNSPKSVAPH